MLKRIGLTVLGVFAVLLLGILGALYVLSQRQPPSGERGPAAEALTDRVEQAVRLDAFRDLDAIEFTFGPRNRRHLLDQKRGLVQVESAQWNESETGAGAQNRGASEAALRVQFDRNNPERCRILRKNEAGSDPAQRRKLCRKAYEAHVNDFFWLAPWSQLRAPGAIRERIAERALLVRYPEGGLTPGDVYLFVVDESGLPLRWEIWTRAIAVQGAVFRFANWETRPPGARFNTVYSGDLRDVRIENLQTYPGYPPPDQPDAFAEFAGKSL